MCLKAEKNLQIEYAEEWKLFCVQLDLKVIFFLIIGRTLTTQGYREQLAYLNN